ncbi:hypothetical protein J5N97_020018 [Dioscorea zingiberensis]|uniref:Uncharacterized protein n=1 Tax=Dioscorea zingiberensis TaxID=325984 RepID=A0A9D5CFU3_9LILI|nr:hypothetical protein J5N97_020018 [Dioscorea zingiberensis]
MGRSPCCEKSHTNKGAWTKEEDEKLISYIKVHGEGCWRSLPKAAGLFRCGKSCRLRWINYLRPDLKRGNFSDEEDELIIKLHSLLGNKWSLIAGRLPGRTDNEIKNYWNTHIKRKLLSRGLDPQTHRRRQENPKEITDQSTDEEPSSQINLELSISLPYTSDDHRKPEGLPEFSPMMMNSSFARISTDHKTLCLCYNLGFQRGQTCACQSMQRPQVIGFCRPL